MHLAPKIKAFDFRLMVELWLLATILVAGDILTIVSGKW